MNFRSESFYNCGSNRKGNLILNRNYVNAQFLIYQYMLENDYIEYFKPEIIPPEIVSSLTFCNSVLRIMTHCIVKSNILCGLFEDRSYIYWLIVLGIKAMSCPLAPIPFPCCLYQQSPTTIVP